MGTFRRTVVSDVGDDATVQEDVATERRWALDLSDITALLAGLFYAVIGILALIELGVDEFPSEATTQVVDLTHTQLWGAVDIALGLLLLAAVGGWGRSLTTFAGAVLLVVGIVVVAGHEELDPVLATESAYGWVAAGIGALVLLAAIAVPSVSSHRARLVDRSV